VGYATNGIDELHEVLELVAEFRRIGEVTLALDQAKLLAFGANALVSQLRDESEGYPRELEPGEVLREDLTSTIWCSRCGTGNFERVFQLWPGGALHGLTMQGWPGEELCGACYKEENGCSIPTSLHDLEAPKRQGEAREGG
jgi:hypothetical protein